MAPSVGWPTLGFGSGHELVVPEFEPHIDLHADSVEPAWDSLSLPVSLPFLLSFSFSLSLSLSLSLSQEINIWGGRGEGKVGDGH